MSFNPSQYAFLVRPNALLGGSHEMKAELVRMSDTGEILDYPYSDRYLNHFLVSAYVERNTDEAYVYGLATSFREVYSIELDTAESMFKILRTVERGLSKLNESAGYVKSGDYFSYLTRAASVLKVRRFYTLNTRKRRDISGQRYSSVTGAALQSYIEMAIDDIINGRVDNYS